jgi:predicted esterase
MNLNQLYQNINKTLDIPRDQRPAIMALHGSGNSNATMAGYWRKPDATNRRYRLMTPPVLLIYCQGIMDMRPPDDPAQRAAIEAIIQQFSNHQLITAEQVEVFYS